MKINVGDLVRYRNATFASTRVSDGFLGLVIDVIPSPNSSAHRTVRVRWNTSEEMFEEMWHDPRNLELVNENR